MRGRTLAQFLGVVVVFGTAFPAIEVGLEALPPLLFAAARYGVAAALLVPFAARSRDDWLPTTRGDRAAVLAGGVLFVGGTGLTFLGQQFTTGGVAAILVSLSPVLTALFGWVLLPEERLSARGAVGVLVGFVGVAVVVSPDPAAVRASAGGETLVLAAAVVVTLGTVLVRRSRPALPTVALTGWSMLLGAAVLVVAALAAGESAADVHPTARALAALGYLAVVVSTAGFVAYFDLLARVGALEANLVTYLMPVVAVVTGALLLGEPVALSSLVGFLVIFAGFLLLKARDVAEVLARFRGTAG